MPRKNEIKIYYENAFYHVYNRGVEKRDIFLDENDYRVFINLLKTSLSDPEILKQETALKGCLPALQEDTLQKTPFHPRKNFFGKIKLLCYCLMPNHFHLLVNQSDKQGLTGLLRTVSTSYSMYFNKKYDRIGTLFQGPFKAIDIRDEPYLLWISRYIHRNPFGYRDYSYSSYQEYRGTRKTSWVNSKTLLEYSAHKELQEDTLQSARRSYLEFVEAEKEVSEDVASIVLEED